MKVMQINCVYKNGSTGKIMYDIHTELKKRGIESVICYGRGERIDEENVYKTSSEFMAKFNNVKSRFTGMPYNGSFFATNKLIRIIKKEKPDVVHLHCINGYFVNIYRLVEFLKKNKIPTVVTHHAEFFFTGNCGHSYECEKWKMDCGNCPSAKRAVNSYYFDFTKKNFKMMKKAFVGFSNICSVSVSKWLEDRSYQSPIFKNIPHTTILNGLDADIFCPQDGALALKEKLGIPADKKVILHVTASFKSEVKGGKYVIELAERLGDKAVIVVVGNRETPIDLPKNIIAVGRVENQKELAKYYTMADLSVVTGKRETFSMPVAESLCCGTPAVGFCAGGPEAIAISEYTEFVRFGDIDALTKIVDKWIDKKTTFEGVSQAAILKYSKEKMAQEYIDIYYKLQKGKD